MAKRTVEESSLTAVADAIRERAGTSEPLVFPEGYKSAVEGIEDTTATLIMGKLTEYVGKTVTYCNSWAFSSFTSLVSLSLPNCTLINSYAFNGRNKLETIDIPKCTHIHAYAFQGCSSLSRLDVPMLKVIDALAFSNCSALDTLVLSNSTAICQLLNSNAFSGTPIANGTGYIYVHKMLDDGSDGVTAHQQATNWSTYASQIRAIEDYPEITGGAV